MQTITSANAQLTLSIPDVFPTPQPIEGFATDDAFDTENVSPNETLMGVDGNLSGGYTPYPVKFKIVLQADSVSQDVFDQWRQAMDAAKEAFAANATLVADSVGKIYTFTKGFLTGDMPTPPGKKVLQAQTYEITFQSVSAAPV
jgi:hypothetical protein